MTVLTGFLGSGKTTLLNRLVRSNALSRAAVIINEFGEIGLDHELVHRSSENLVLLNNGCVCCSVRGDLIDTLEELVQYQAEGSIPPLDRVVIETTGLADPAPIAHTLMSDHALLGDFVLGGVVTTVDAVNGLRTLGSFSEAVRQVGIADLLLLTKIDLAGKDALASLRARVAAINPGVRTIEAENGGIDPGAFFVPGVYSAGARSSEVQGWLNAEAYAAAERDARMRAHHHADGDVAENAHSHIDEQIKAFCVTRDEPIAFARFNAWLDLVKAMRGDDLLRVKGIIGVAEDPDRPMVIHGVQHVFHPPVRLDAWPSFDRRTRIVFITRNIDKDTIEDTLRIFERRART